MDKPLKIIHVGEAGVGKSSLLLRYTDDTFAEHPISTIGVDYKSCSLTRGGNTFELQIWDTAGQERFRTLGNTQYRGADGVMVLFSAATGEGFVEATQWLQEIHHYARRDISVMLVGTQCDLIERRGRGVGVEQVRRVLEECAAVFGERVPYVETSAKEALNVALAFEVMAFEVVRKNRAACSANACLKECAAAFVVAGDEAAAEWSWDEAMAGGGTRGRAQAAAEEAQRRRIVFVWCALRGSSLPVEIVSHVEAMVDWRGGVDVEALEAAEAKRTNGGRRRKRCAVQ